MPEVNQIVEHRLLPFIVFEQETMLQALRKIDENRQGFVIVVDKTDTLLGVLTDGDIRRAILKNHEANDHIVDIYTKNSKFVHVTAGLDAVTELFKNQAIKFLPIVDEDGKLKNIITKSQVYTLLLQDIHANLSYDFFSLDTSIIDHEIFQRPWGFYKTTVLNDYYQAKVISVKPGGQLSLQSHNRREEHWIVVHGKGNVQIDQSILSVTCGSSVFIPKGAKHRLINTSDKDTLVLTEVQIGDYLGEDDIIRYEDIYGRA